MTFPDIQVLRSAALKGAIPLERRMALLLKLRASLQKNSARISAALQRDLGKGSFEAWTTEVGFLLSEISYFAKELPHLVATEKVSTPLTMQPGKSFIQKEPFGVVLVLAPWNYPVQLAFSPMIGAIAAGNRVVVKPSEISMASSAVIAEIVDEVFAPDEVRTIQGGVEETTALLRERFDYIFFTGSTAVGKVVMKAAAEHLTPVTLELGGKSPCLVDASASIAQAARRIAWGKWMNAGQTCVAPDYVLVPRHQEAIFINELRISIEQFYGANPELSPDYGRIVSTRHHERLMSLIANATVAIGGQHDEAKRYLAPTVVHKIDATHPLMQEEIFGPILVVMPYDDFDAAIQFIKQRPKPLAFYFFGQDSQREAQAMTQISFGGGCVNDTVIHLANGKLPFGGVGESGMGAYHGDLSFSTFTHRKAVFKQSTLVDVPVRYPPYKGKEGLVKFLMD